MNKEKEQKKLKKERKEDRKRKKKQRARKSGKELFYVLLVVNCAFKISQNFGFSRVLHCPNCSLKPDLYTCRQLRDIPPTNRSSTSHLPRGFKHHPRSV